MAPDAKADEARRLTGGVHGSKPGDIHLNAFQRCIVRILGGPAAKS